MEVAQLYQQHTDDTGQVFTIEAIETAFDLTQGQPWLVNAIAKEVVEEIMTDFSIAITIAPHLVMMASLHLVVNGGGTLEREYAIGRDRMDLCLRYGRITLGIELKAWRDKKGDPMEADLEQ